jgi:hypothetical protein
MGNMVNRTLILICVTFSRPSGDQIPDERRPASPKNPDGPILDTSAFSSAIWTTPILVLTGLKI